MSPRKLHLARRARRPRVPAAPTDRLVLRRRLLRWTAPVLVVAGVCGGKLLAMSAAAEVAQSAFAVGNEDAAGRAAATLAVANVVEAWKAPFAEGTVLAAGARTVADLSAAEALLREALALAEGVQECAVRYNLALVVEAQGDAVGEAAPGEDAGAAAAKAEALYRAASEIASAAPTQCRDLPPLTEHPAPDPESDDEGGGGEEDGGEDGGGGEPGEGDEGSADGDASGGRTAADDLQEAADRSDGKAEAARQRGGEPGEAEGAAPGDQPPADAETQPAPPDPTRTQELEQRQVEADQRQRHADDGRAAEESEDGAGAPLVPSPW